jgi:hypothetical protein
VSVRLTVSNEETLVANALRRSLRMGETEVVPRVSDLDALAAATAGKVEIESIGEGRDEQIVAPVQAAVLTVFKGFSRSRTWRARRLRQGTVVNAGSVASTLQLVTCPGVAAGRLTDDSRPRR